MVSSSVYGRATIPSACLAALQAPSARDQVSRIHRLTASRALADPSLELIEKNSSTPWSYDHQGDASHPLPSNCAEPPRPTRSRLPPIPDLKGTVTTLTKKNLYRCAHRSTFKDTLLPPTIRMVHSRPGLACWQDRDWTCLASIPSEGRWDIRSACR